MKRKLKTQLNNNTKRPKVDTDSLGANCIDESANLLTNFIKDCIKERNVDQLCPETLLITNLAMDFDNHITDDVPLPKLFSTVDTYDPEQHDLIANEWAASFVNAVDDKQMVFELLELWESLGNQEMFLFEEIWEILRGKFISALYEMDEMTFNRCTCALYSAKVSFRKSQVKYLMKNNLQGALKDFLERPTPLIALYEDCIIYDRLCC